MVAGARGADGDAGDAVAVAAAQQPLRIQIAILREQMVLEQAEHRVGAAQRFEAAETEAATLILVADRCEAEIRRSAGQLAQRGGPVPRPARDHRGRTLRFLSVQKGAQRLGIGIAPRSSRVAKESHRARLAQRRLPWGGDLGATWTVTDTARPSVVKRCAEGQRTGFMRPLRRGGVHIRAWQAWGKGRSAEARRAHGRSRYIRQAAGSR